MKRLPATVAAVVMAGATLGCGSDEATTPTLALRPTASVPVPFSNDEGVALVEQNLVCVTNSYEVRVLCVRRDGSVVGVFGREGEGPGEFDLTPLLLRGPGRTIGAVSFTRLLVFTPSGNLVNETILPVAPFMPATNAFGATLLGHQYNDGMNVTPVEMDVAARALLWEREDINDIALTECGRIALGVASPTGGWTFPACQRELVFLEDRDASTATVIQSPTYAEEFPNERDIAEVEARNRRSPFRTDVGAYKETPKRYHLRVASLAYDDRDRLWVATERDRAVYSYFDLYVGTEYVGSVRIRDRILGYDLYGSTLAVLVERAPDTDGIAWRAVDWYDIGGLDLGLR